MLNYRPLKKIMPTDDTDKFFMIKDFVMPIFAHVFLNDIYDEKNNIPNKTLSEQICGSSMERGNAATIRKKSEDFLRLQKLF